MIIEVEGKFPDQKINENIIYWSDCPIKLQLIRWKTNGYLLDPISGNFSPLNNTSKIIWRCPAKIIFLLYGHFFVFIYFFLIFNDDRRV